MGIVTVRFAGRDRPADARTFVILQAADANGLPLPCGFDLAGDLNDDYRVDFRDVPLLADNSLIDCNLTVGGKACLRRRESL